LPIRAGVGPGAGVNPVVAQVLAERGLPVTDHVPTKLDYDLVEAADVVITMGCGETCPVFPGSATRTGESTTPPARTCPRSAPASTTSTPGFAACSPS
jgi:protein-tyrosine-phosphatase